ncbi:MAG: glycosyltransferase, partial [Dysgonamonadaceae bacterium]|nr:glycosyltransferase [Dysgonamonadaceae bacterium]
MNTPEAISLSICIPVFNSDVRYLTQDLARQCETLGAEWEILLIDDASDEAYRTLNRDLASLNGVRYIELPENIGRSAIRNKLADESRYRYLLFMDCDAEIASNYYLQKYSDVCKPGVVCYGGKINPAVCPDAKSCLRWKYSKRREEIGANIRNQHPNRNFITFNFIIDKNIFKIVRFDENLNTYGHEDTLLGLDLQKNNITVRHIDNPLMYAKFDSASVFVQKTEQGILNLIALQRKYPELEDDVKLLRTAKRIRTLRLAPVIRALFCISRTSLLKNLYGNKPSLCVLDFYKLGYL